MILLALGIIIGLLINPAKEKVPLLSKKFPFLNEKASFIEPKDLEEDN